MAYDMNQQIESLSDRLNKIDQYSKATVPEAFNYLTGLQRPEGANPLPIEAQKLTVGTLAKNQYDSGMKYLTDLLGIQKEDERFNKNYTLEQQKLALDANKSGLTIDNLGNFVSAGGVRNLTDAEAIAQVQKKYGKDIQLGKTIKERGERARSILQMESEGTTLPIQDLLSPAEQAKRDAATNLIKSASEIYSAVTGQTGENIDAPGVGYFAGKMPSWLISSGGQALRSKVTQLTADKIKELSGAAVSDREVQRLSKYLPQTDDTEKIIAAKTKTIINSIEIGLKMQEKAKLENLTLDQAYEKYAAQEYQNVGEEVPIWLSKNNPPTPTPGGAQTNPYDKYWNE